MPPIFSPNWLKLFVVLLVAASTFLWSCDKTEEAVKPEILTATKGQTIKSGNDKENKDDKYKSDKTGQYVSKDVQVTGYEDGSERPTRPKYDAAGTIRANYIDPCDGCGGTGGPYTPPPSTFVSSEGVGDFVNWFSGDIYALRVIVGDNEYVLPSEGHIKLNADLNRGAGGKYIYLTFTRNPQYSYENDGVHAAITYDKPITGIYVEAHTQVGNLNDGAPLNSNWRHLYRFDGTTSLYPSDLNDGAGGRYIYGYVTRMIDVGMTPIKEVGILYGQSSSIEPPSGWIKEGRDLNEGAGGDYIYICYKK